MWLIKIESSENVQHAWSGLPADKAEKKFAKLHPALHAWFTAEDRRQQLVNRTDQGHYFWELRSCAYWEEFLEPKIIVPAITATPMAAVDQAGFFSNNKSTIFLPPSTALAAACVNSRIAAWLAVQTFATKQGGFFDFEPRYSSQIPIPTASNEQIAVIERIVEAITVGTRRPDYERLLNGLVYELFFPEDLHAQGIRLFDACAAAGIRAGMKAKAVAAAIFQPGHAIGAQLARLQTLEVVRLIENQPPRPQPTPVYEPNQPLAHAA